MSAPRFQKEESRNGESREKGREETGDKETEKAERKGERRLVTREGFLERGVLGNLYVISHQESNNFQK